MNRVAHNCPGISTNFVVVECGFNLLVAFFSSGGDLNSEVCCALGVAIRASKPEELIFMVGLTFRLVHNFSHHGGLVLAVLAQHRAWDNFLFGHELLVD